MRSIAEIEGLLDRFEPIESASEAARRLVELAEEVLAHWIIAKGEVPTMDEREGSRLLALHRQGAHGVPSFNACRETCREIAYHYNLLCLQPAEAAAGQRQRMMAMLAMHLALFVGGKMQQEQLGEFCCASKPLRLESAA